MPIPIRLERWFWLIFSLVIAGVLFPFWRDSHIPAFRDGFHFYYPQAVWLDGCYDRGELFPQWNPNEGLGVSVAGQPTWQLYYPLRAIWFCPGLDVAQRYALFVAVHLLLAAAGMLRAGYWLQLSPTARWLGAIAFSLSCPVLFQLNNLIYLCSATWVAWGLVPIMQLVCSRASVNGAIRWCFYGRVLCEIISLGCLMTVAGDPHGAVNLAIVTLGAIAFHCWPAITRSLAVAQPTDPSLGSPTKVASLVQRLWLPGIAVLLLALAIRQTQAALPWYGLSSRAGASVQQSDSFHPEVDRILSDASLVQPQRIFDFSLSPWNFPTIVWPTWAGHFQPSHSRWVQAIASEGRMWIPSLYLGIIPVMLGLDVLLARQARSSSERFLIGLGILATLLAMGNYSLVWLLRNILDGFGATGLSEQLPTDAQGSFYGVLVAMIPGYDGFRYPAKWSVWIVASLALLASHRFDQRVRINPLFNDIVQRRFRRFIAVSALVGFLLLALYQIGPLESELRGWLQQSVDPMLGSPDPSSSLGAVVRSLLQPAMVLAGVVALWRLGPLSTPAANERASWLILMLALVDLASLAPQWIVSTAAPALSSRGIEHGVVQSDDQSGRAASLCWANISREKIELISHRSSPLLSETLRLQELFLHGKLCHLQGRAALHASGSIDPQAVIVIKRWLQRNDTLQADQPELDSVLRALGVDQRLIQSQTGQLEWKAISNVRPLCEFIPDQADFAQAKETVSRACQWKWLSCDQLQIELDLSQAGKLLVRQLNDGGWKVRSNSGPVAAIDSTQLFVVFPIATGKQTIVLCR